MRNIYYYGDVYDAKPETAAKQHDLICTLSSKPYSIQMGNFYLLDWLSPLNSTIPVYFGPARL